MKVQFLGRYVAPEMVVLSMAEMILTFILALVLLTPAAGSFDISSVNPALLCTLTVGFTTFTVGLYRPQIFSRARNLVFNTLLSAILSFPAVWIVSKVVGLSAYWPVGYDPLRPIKIIAIWCVGVVSLRLLFLIAARCNMFLHRVAVIKPTDPADLSPANLANVVRASKNRFLDVTVIQPEQASASYLKSERFRTLILPSAGPDVIPPAIRSEYRRCGIYVQNQADFCERHLRRIDLAAVDDAWVDTLSAMSANHLTPAAARAFDIILSIGLLVVTLPLMGLVTIAVALDSTGPILYRQERLGLNGRPFVLLKFRSMRSNAEALGPSWAQQKDPRVTRIGLLMRKTRIDELPQLINILRGEMSFIGPRPERPHFVEQLRTVIPFFEQRARVKPGLTGWAQVNYPYGASVEDAKAKLSYDLYYVKNRTLFLDILILLSTVRVILFQEGAR